MTRWPTIAAFVLAGCQSDGDFKAPFATPQSADTATADDPGGEHDSGEPASGDDTATDCDACPESTVTAMWSMDTTEWAFDSARTRNNALKGFITSYLWGTPVTDFPDQMEFLYLPMNQLWGPEGDRIDEALEPLMAAAAERNHHVVLRVFVDYPSRPTGLPEHLAETVSCNPYTEHGGGCSPDYDHPDMLAAMVGLIEALGARYNGDPRLGFVQLGMLGFWGEWHTWPHGDWFPSVDTQNAVLDAYEAAFPDTFLQARYPSTSMTSRSVGYHDDSFAHSTLGDIDWFFHPRTVASGAEYRWHDMPIGGELRPELQGEVFSDSYVLGEYAQDMNACIDTTHVSYLLNFYAFNGDGTGYVGDDRTRAEQAAIRMGYQFELRAASLRLSGLDGDTVEATVSVEIEQSGVAPFYYPLFVSVASDSLGTGAVGTTDLSDLLPGVRRTINLPLGRVAVAGLSEPWTLTLDGPMISAGQRVRLGTAVPGTATDEPTRLHWSPQCTVGDAAIPVGTPVDASGGECDCRCEVDGAIRDCFGDLCDAATP
jgi:hypothetical protein